MTAKEEIKALVDAQPDDASFDEIFRQLVFSHMVCRGLADVRDGRVISNGEMERRIRYLRN